MQRLAHDECCIGKIPDVEESQIADLFNDWKPAASGNFTWEILREGLNSWTWKLLDRETLDEMVNDFFARAQRAKMQGKDAEWKDLTQRALRLQGSLTKTRPIEVSKQNDTGANVRQDTFVRHVHRRKDDMHPDDVFGDCTDDRTLTHTFKV